MDMESGTLTLTSGKSFSTISKLDDLTSIYIRSNAACDLDLSGFSKLTKFHQNGDVLKCFVKLPATCTSVIFTGLDSAPTPDLSLLDNFSLTIFNSKRESIESILKSIRSGKKLSLLDINEYSIFDLTATDFSFLSSIYDTRNEKLKVDSFYLTLHGDYCPNIESLNGIQTLEGLKDFRILNNGYYLKKLKDVSQLNVHSATLEKVILDNCSIVDCRFIIDCTKLTYVDLKNNCLQPYIEVVSTDEEGNETKIKWYTIKEICERMATNATINSNGNVTQKVTLCLKGNSSISDWGYYINNSKYWDETSNYGN